MATSNEYTIGQRHRAHYNTSGSFVLVHFDGTALTVEREAIPTLLNAILAGDAPEGTCAMAWSAHQRVDTLLARTGEAVGAVAKQEKAAAAERTIQADTQRSIHQRIDQWALEIAKLRDAVVSLDGDDGLHAQVANLSLLVQGILTDAAAQQTLLQKLAEAPRPAQATPADTTTYATREYVDAGLKRLSGALRDHIAQVMRDAVRAMAPPPGLITRLRRALTPAEPTTAERARARVGTTKVHSFVSPTFAAQADSLAEEQGIP